MKGTIRLIRALEWYQIVGQELIGEITLPDLDVSHLEQLFGVQENTITPDLMLSIVCSGRNMRCLKIFFTGGLRILQMFLLDGT